MGASSRPLPKPILVKCSGRSTLKPKLFNFLKQFKITFFHSTTSNNTGFDNQIQHTWSEFQQLIIFNPFPINLSRRKHFCHSHKLVGSVGSGRYWFVSSVRSSNSHPNLLVIQHPTHFFRSHRSSTLDFHFLSHYSYIKAKMLYKGNHWTQLLATWVQQDITAR